MIDPTTLSPLQKARRGYFGRIKNAVQSIMEGMSVTLGYLFQDGPPLPPPFPECGQATLPTDEILGCKIGLEECP